MNTNNEKLTGKDAAAEKLTIGLVFIFLTLIFIKIIFL